LANQAVAVSTVSAQKPSRRKSKEGGKVDTPPTVAVRAETEGSDPPTFSVHTGKQLTSFTEYTPGEVRRLLLKSPPKTCPLDPLPTDVSLELVDVLLPFITAMCNASLREGVLPASQKAAIITPVVKKSGLAVHVEEPQSYRPISNLTLIVEGD